MRVPSCAIVVFAACASLIAAFSACEIPVDGRSMRKEEVPVPPPPPPREWTFVAYMCADNDLEESAIEDLNEMEAVDWSSGSVTLLALVDRAEGNDSSNGDWKDTRLYRIVTDPAGDNQTIVSDRIDCPPLGISATGETELNMSNQLTLSRALEYAVSAFPAEHYGLVVWGHGTGWRSVPSATADAVGPARAIAVDKTSDAYMTIADFGSAIRGKGVSVVGFDTCFAVTLELLYEIRSDAESFVGSVGVEPQNGWAYDLAFKSFMNGKKTGDAFCDSVLAAFAERYAGETGSSASKVVLPSVGELFESFDALAGSIATGITGASERNAALDAMLGRVKLYRGVGYPTDCFADIGSFAEVFATVATGFAGADDIKLRADAVARALGTAVPVTWSASGGWKSGGVCVNFVPFIAGNTPLFPHDSAYVRGSGASGQSSFVRDSAHWVPNLAPSPSSFIDKLFYFPL